VEEYQDRGLATTIVRPCVAYGPGDRYFTPLALRLAGLPILPLVNGGRARLDLIYVRDLAELLWLAGQEPAAAGRIYNAGPGRPGTLADLVQAYRELTGRGPRIVPVSPWAARCTAWLSRTLLRPFIPEAAGALTPQGFDLMSRDIHLDITRAQEELGFRPRFTLKDGLAETLKR
jgi:nucleoside-diphosphate-sugar epimerase